MLLSTLEPLSVVEMEGKKETSGVSNALVLLLRRSHHTPHLLHMGFSLAIVLLVFFPSSILPLCSLWTQCPPRPGALRALSFLGTRA